MVENHGRRNNLLFYGIPEEIAKTGMRVKEKFWIYCQTTLKFHLRTTLRERIVWNIQVRNADL